MVFESVGGKMFGRYLRNAKGSVDNFSVSYRVACILALALPTVLWSNPFDKYESELDSVVGGLTRTGFFNGDPKLAKFFQTGTFQPTEDSVEPVGMEELPKYLKFSAIVSSKIIHEKGEVVKKHTVKSKDTLTSLSKSYNTSVERIKKQNGLKTDTIRLGDILEIPVVTGTASKKKVVTKRVFINPVPESRITSRFGRRKDPFNKYSRNFHSGLDMAAEVGTPVVASADGEVIFTGKHGGYGNTVILLHANEYKTVYAHCSKIVVEVGEKVKMGRVIAAVGRTGTATGAHLHFEVHKNGKITNPERALNSFEQTITKLTGTDVAGI